MFCMHVIPHLPAVATACRIECIKHTNWYALCRSAFLHLAATLGYERGLNGTPRVFTEDDQKSTTFPTLILLCRVNKRVSFESAHRTVLQHDSQRNSVTASFVAYSWPQPLKTGRKTQHVNWSKRKHGTLSATRKLVQTETHGTIHVIIVLNVRRNHEAY